MVRSCSCALPSHGGALGVRFRTSPATTVPSIGSRAGPATWYSSRISIGSDAPLDAGQGVSKFISTWSVQAGVQDRLWPLQTLPDGRNGAHSRVLIFSLTLLTPDTEIRPPDLLWPSFSFLVTMHERWWRPHCFSSPPALHLLYYSGRRWPTEDMSRYRLRLLCPSQLLSIQLIGFSSSTRF